MQEMTHEDIQLSDRKGSEQQWRPRTVNREEGGARESGSPWRVVEGLRPEANYLGSNPSPATYWLGDPGKVPHFHN